MVLETSLRQLVFSSRVLGQVAADNLRCGRITQTIRSRKQAAPFLSRRGTYIQIVLDNVMLYEARLTELVRKPLRDLGVFDAEIGGFLSERDLRKALVRAGFRFKPFFDYTDTFAIQFRRRDY